jgi:hypothetical protein
MNSTVFWNITLCSPLKSTDVSEEHIASIFRVEEKAEQETRARLATFFRAGVLLDLFFDPEDGDDTFLRNVG